MSEQPILSSSSTATTSRDSGSEAGDPRTVLKDITTNFGDFWNAARLFGDFMFLITSTIAAVNNNWMTAMLDCSLTLTFYRTWGEKVVYVGIFYQG